MLHQLSYCGNANGVRGPVRPGGARRPTWVAFITVSNGGSWRLSGGGAVAGHVNIAQAVRDYIDARPPIQEAYRLGIVNAAALARRIQEELGIDRPDAVLAACRKYDHRGSTKQAATLREALGASQLEIRTGVGLLAFEPGWNHLAVAAKIIADEEDRDKVHVLNGWSGLQIVAEENLLDAVLPRMQDELLVEARRGLVEINIRSPPHIEEVPGFIAAITHALAQRGIRIVDATTCGDDHIFLLESANLAGAVDALHLLLHDA